MGTVGVSLRCQLGGCNLSSISADIVNKLSVVEGGSGPILWAEFVSQSVPATRARLERMFSPMSPCC